MTEVDNLIYKLLQKIPKGKVVTYGQIAKVLALPTPRMVGRTLHRNPDPENFPCHRVVFHDGSLAPSYAFGGNDAQKIKLQSEGVKFAGEKVDLKKALFNFN